MDIPISDEYGLSVGGRERIVRRDQRTVTAELLVFGLANPGGVVTVNGQSVYRKGEYFRKELSVDNTSAPVRQQVDAAAPSGMTITRHEFVPKTPEAFTYDADDNLTQDGLWVYSWDAENRLVAVESLGDAPAGSWRRVTWEYDGQGRRIRQTTESGEHKTAGCHHPQPPPPLGGGGGWNFGGGVPGVTAFGLSPGYCLEPFQGSEDRLWKGHKGTSAGTYFCAYDGNGNVMALVNAADGSVASRYEYGPFGEVIRATGPMARVNPFRFSTKYQDEETGLVYYGYRYYEPSTGRWVSRDSAEEDGGPNLYGFVGNDPIGAVDPFGLATYTLSAGKQWAYSFGFISIGGANGLHVTITATSSDLCRFDSDPTATSKLKTRWFWHKYSDNTTSKTYDSDRKCKDCRMVQCFKYHRDVTWQANSIVPRPLPRVFHMYQTVTVDFTVCADGIGNSASASGSQRGHNIDMFFRLEDF